MLNFLIIVTGYNCSEYAKECYNAVIAQAYKNFKAIFISDGSTDGTNDIIARTNFDYRIVIENHKENLGAAKRRYDAIKRYGRPKDIIVLHGMDDKMFPDALAVIAEHYKAGKWMTYGNWINQHGVMLPDGFLEFPEEIHRSRDYRKVLYRSTGLNTFYKFLHDRIPEADFKIDGKWIDSTTESEVMFSCLEMCGKNRIGIVEKAICLYRENLPGGSLNRLGREYKYKLLEIIKARPKRRLLRLRKIEK